MIYIRTRTIRISYIRFLQVFLTVMKLFVKINPMDIRNPDIKKHAKIQVGDQNCCIGLYGHGISKILLLQVVYMQKDCGVKPGGYKSLRG